MSKSAEVIHGAIDMHCHGYPEISLDFQNARDENDDMIRHCIDAGMRGIVLKANVFAAITECYYMQKQFPNFLVMPSLTLNSPSGGLDPLTVEMALNLGAKVIHLPTWGAWNDIRTANFSPRLRKWCKYADTITEDKGIRVTTEDFGKGELKEETINIIELCKEYDCVLFTGHLHKEEAKKVMDYADKIGYHRVVYCHPLSLDGNLDDMKWAISKGAHVEFIYITLLPAYQRETPQQIADLINTLGAKNVILSSDHYDEYSPSTAEMNRLWAANLMNCGITEDQIRQIMVKNTAELLKLPTWDEILAEREKEESELLQNPRWQLLPDRNLEAYYAQHGIII